MESVESKPVQRGTIGPAKIFIYGTGNFASQLSWTMVSTYLTLFYTDVFGLEAGAVALLLLIAKTIDAINDPIMGALMEHTHTKWGRFRPFMVIGAPLLLIFTILTFTVPEFGSGLKLLYAYLTYIGLSIAYSIVNIPYTAMPAVLSTNRTDINRLNTANMMGMTIGMIALNLCTLPLINFFGHGQQSAGYHITAMLYAVIALPLFWIVAAVCKEKVVVKKEYQVPIRKSIKFIFKSKNLIMALLYNCLTQVGMLGRIGVAVYFYMYVVQNYQFITIFMMMQMLVGTLVMPFSPKVMKKLGKRNTAVLSDIIQIIALAMMFFGPYKFIPYLFVCHILYGLGYIAGPCGSCMLIDVIDEIDEKNGVRLDGTIMALSNFTGKIGSAIGTSVSMAVIGYFGYVGGQKITPHIQFGINFASNILPIIFFGLCIVTLFLYTLSDNKMEEIRDKLDRRNAQRESSCAS